MCRAVLLVAPMCSVLQQSVKAEETETLTRTTQRRCVVLLVAAKCSVPCGVNEPCFLWLSCAFFAALESVDAQAQSEYMMCVTANRKGRRRLRKD